MSEKGFGSVDGKILVCVCIFIMYAIHVFHHALDVLHHARVGCLYVVPHAYR